MSKNHPHDNIYSILAKLEALQPTTQEQHDAKVQQIRESVEAQGSILSGVDAVQSKLARQFAESNDGNLANNAKPYDKVTQGDVVAGRLGKDEMGGKDKKVDEKAVSQAQQKFMGMVHAAQQGSKAASPAVAKVAKTMGKKDARDFAATKHKGLPQHVNEKYDAVKAVKQCAIYYMEMNGIRSVHDLEAEDIESIGGDCQMNYQDVCEILGCNLPDSLGPVQSWDTDAQGNKFDLEEATCNECGMYESKCACPHTNEDMSRAAKGHEKYGKKGMEALAKAGREGKSLDKIRDKYDKYDENMNNECAMCEAGTCSEHTMEEGEVSHPEKGVTRHTKTDFPGYPADDYADDETERTAKKGRPRKAQTVKPRVDPNAPKKGRGRPKAEKPGFQGGIASMNDPFGRSPSKAPKSKIKGHVHTMGEAMDRLSQRFARIVEGVNFRTMAEETNQTIDELMMELQQDINSYKSTGHCSDKLKDFLQVHSHAKKQMADEAVNPNNPFYKKQNDYDLPPSLRGHGTADYKLPDVKAHDNVERDNYRDRAGLNPLHDELNELARLAGIADEGNAFTGKLKATDHGDDFELDGKTFTDNSTLDEEPNEGNEFSGELVKARAQHRDSFDVDGKEYPVKEADAPVATKGANPVNAPKEKYYSMKASTLNPGEGDNGEKAMHGDKPTFKNGDNPLSKTAITPVREATLSLEARLAAEYESIKKGTK